MIFPRFQSLHYFNISPSHPPFTLISKQALLVAMEVCLNAHGWKHTPSSSNLQSTAQSQMPSIMQDTYHNYPCALAYCKFRTPLSCCKFRTPWPNIQNLLLCKLLRQTAIGIEAVRRPAMFRTITNLHHGNAIHQIIMSTIHFFFSTEFHN